MEDLNDTTTTTTKTAKELARIERNHKYYLKKKAEKEMMCDKPTILKHAEKMASEVESLKVKIADLIDKVKSLESVPESDVKSEVAEVKSEPESEPEVKVKKPRKSKKVVV